MPAVLRHVIVLLLIPLLSGCGNGYSTDQRSLATYLSNGDNVKSARLVNSLGAKAIPVLMDVCPTLADSRQSGCFALMALNGRQYNDPRVYDCLIGHLDDSNQETAVSAAYALGVLGDKRALVPVQSLLGKTTDKRQQTRIAQAISRLER